MSHTLETKIQKDIFDQIVRDTAKVDNNNSYKRISHFTNYCFVLLFAYFFLFDTSNDYDIGSM